MLELRVRCSKGTYVRMLAEDIGEALGCGAHLRRAAAHGFGALSRRAGRDARSAGGIASARERLLPLPALLDGLPRAELGAAEEARLRNGQALQISGLHAGLCAVCGADGAVIGLGSADGERRSAGRLSRLLAQTAEKHLKSARAR